MDEWLHSIEIDQWDRHYLAPERTGWVSTGYELDSFYGDGILIMNMRQSWDRFIFRMGIPILVTRRIYIETAPCWHLSSIYVTTICRALTGRGVAFPNAMAIMLEPLHWWNFPDGPFSIGDSIVGLYLLMKYHLEYIDLRYGFLISHT